MLKLEGFLCLVGGFQVVVLSLVYIFISHTVANPEKYTNSVLITIVDGEFDAVNSIVEKYGLEYQRQILPRVHEYEYKPEPGLSKILMALKVKAIKAKAANKILDIYHEKLITLPHDTQATVRSQVSDTSVRKRALSELLGSPHFGMQILDAWGQGYRGDGVVVGVVDTGVEVTHLDLKPNIDMNLSRNFVRGRPDTDVYPDILPSYPEFDILSDHGNNCAGLIAAVQDNLVCSSGVAPNAKLAGLKVLGLNDPYLSSSIFNFRPTNLVEAVTYKSDQIHIYSNSYGPGEDFALSTFVVNEAFRTGVSKGRHGRGSIYVIAAGNQGHHKNANLDGYVNSIYTIAISSVGVNGTIPNYAQPGTCIIASTYGEGLNKHGETMVTTSHRNSCTTEFKRTSASAAIASSIIALALQANPKLTWRDVQHIITNTSSVDGLEGCDHSTTNAAGFSYHPFFGFGLMNASALVVTAKHWNPVPAQNIIHASTFVRDHRRKEPVYTLSLDICTEQSRCLFFTEHVVAYIEYFSYYDKLVEFQICAPTNTCSFILTKQEVRQSQSAKQETRKWNFMSLQFWGEKPNGTWKLMMYLNTSGTTTIDKMFSIIQFNLTVHGYSEDFNGRSESNEDIIRKVDKMAKDAKVDINAALKTIHFLIGLATIAITVFLPASDLHLRMNCWEICKQFFSYIWRPMRGTYVEKIICWLLVPITCGMSWCICRLKCSSCLFFIITLVYFILISLFSQF